ncbi:hypothetical protein YC2023_045290 [Brassica napus]
MPTTTLFQSRSHIRPPEESMIKESLQHASMEPSTRLNTQRQSKLTLQHRSTIPIRNRPTPQRKNRSTIIKENGKTNTISPLWQHTPCIHDYEDERAIEQRATLDEEDRLLHHFSWKKKSPSIDRYATSIDTQPHQPNHLRASTDNAYFPSIDTNVDATRDGDYSIGRWADNRYHESYAVENAYRDQGDDEPNEGFTYEELLNMQRHDEKDQNRAAAAWERRRFNHPIDRESRPSIDTNHSKSNDINNTTSIDISQKQKTTISEKDKSDKTISNSRRIWYFQGPR